MIDVQLHDKPRSARLMHSVAEASRAYRIHRTPVTSATLLGMYRALSNIQNDQEFFDYLVLAVLTDTQQIEDAIVLDQTKNAMKEIEKRSVLIDAFQYKPPIGPDMIDAVLRYAQTAGLSGDKLNDIGAFLLNHVGKRSLVGYL